MNNELVRKMNKVKNNLESAKNNIRYVKDIMDDSITIDNYIFKDGDFSIIENKLDIQINNLNKKIIPKIKNM